ncbi:hypothetical protein J6590_055541 [Homalodisca vitripennis]|nr:hypothetical protein J6590_055541 [Homalodisca vitripennis]
MYLAKVAVAGKMGFSVWLCGIKAGFSEWHRESPVELAANFKKIPFYAVRNYFQEIQAPLAHFRELKDPFESGISGGESEMSYTEPYRPENRFKGEAHQRVVMAGINQMDQLRMSACVAAAAEFCGSLKYGLVPENTSVLRVL